MSDDNARVINMEELEAMRGEIIEFRKMVENNRLEQYNPDYHLTKEDMAVMLGVTTNRITQVAKRWEERGIFKKVKIRYPNGHRGVGYVLLPNWKESLAQALADKKL